MRNIINIIALEIPVFVQAEIKLTGINHLHKGLHSFNILIKTISTIQLAGKAVEH